MLTQAQYQAASDVLAKSIEAPLVLAVDAQRDEVLAGLDVVSRFIAKRMWSAVLAMAPILARVALRAILDKFSATTIGDLADLLYAHKMLDDRRNARFVAFFDRIVPPSSHIKDSP